MRATSRLLLSALGIWCGGILALTLGFELVTVSGKGEAIRVQRRRWTNFGVMGREGKGREGKGRERPMRRYRGMIFAFGPMFS